MAARAATCGVTTCHAWRTVPVGAGQMTQRICHTRTDRDIPYLRVYLIAACITSIGKFAQPKAAHAHIAYAGHTSSRMVERRQEQNPLYATTIYVTYA